VPYLPWVMMGQWGLASLDHSLTYLMTAGVFHKSVTASNHSDILYIFHLFKFRMSVIMFRPNNKLFS